MEPGKYVIVEATTEPVAIWSSEHNAWWRAERCGYVADPTGAGLYTLAEAIDATHHVGPEKRINLKDAPKAAIFAASRNELLAVLKEIAKGEGPFHADPFSHACNVIDAMKRLAQGAIAKAERS